MGRAKNDMMEHDDNIAAATEYLIRLGALGRCDFHGYVVEGDGDLSEKWPIAVSEFKKGSQGLVPWAEDMPLREYTDLLKEAFDANDGGECPGCEKNARE